MEIATDILYHLEAAMEQWTDGRVIESTDLQDLLLFTLYLPKVLSQMGMRYCGCSFRQLHTQLRLTVKVIEAGTPLVGFITANGTIGCMRRFLSLLEDDRLNWVKDRYPWN